MASTRDAISKPKRLRAQDEVTASSLFVDSLEALVPLSLHQGRGSTATYIGGDLDNSSDAMKKNSMEICSRRLAHFQVACAECFILIPFCL